MLGDFASILAPISNRNCTVVMFPVVAAQYKAVSFSEVSASIFAPFLSNNCTTVVCPCLAAYIKAVSPISSFWLILNKHLILFIKPLLHFLERRFWRRGRIPKNEATCNRLNGRGGYLSI